jgi:hypothetical protein
MNSSATTVKLKTAFKEFQRLPDWPLAGTKEVNRSSPAKWLDGQTDGMHFPGLATRGVREARAAAR